MSIRPASLLLTWLLCSTAAAQAPTSAPVPVASGEHLDRAAILATHLSRQEDVRDTLPWAAGVLIGAGGLAGGLAVFHDLMPDGTRIAFGATGAVMVSSGVAGLLAPEPWREGLLGAGAYLGLGGALTGVAIGNDEASDAEPVSPYLMVLAAGYYGSGLLHGISTFTRQPTAPSVLLDDYSRLRTPAQRRALDERSVAAIEQRYRLSEPAIPRYWLAMPMLATGTAVMAAALADDRLSDDAKVGLVASGAAQLFPALIAVMAYGNFGFPLYERELRDAGLRLSLGPGPGEAGLALNGSFE